MYEVHARMTNGEDLSFIFYDLNLDESVPDNFPQRVYHFVVSSIDESGASRRDDLVSGDSNGGGGLTKADATGEVSVFFPLADLNDLSPGVYAMGCRYIIEDVSQTITKQVFAGSLTIDEGHFR